MRFYGREEELQAMRNTREISLRSSQFTVVMGRRRIGKTDMILESVRGTRYVYLFVSRVSEPVLCRNMQNVMEEAGIEFNSPVTTVKAILRAAMIHSRNEPLTLIMDEFQDMKYANKAAFGDIQEIWDTYRNSSHINLIVSGSVHSMMKEIFEDEKAPLFNRPTSRIDLGPFPISLMKRILGDFNPGYENEDLLMLYLLTGGIPFYISVLMDQGAVDKESMLRAVTSRGSIFIDDGRSTLVTEFGKDYNTYFAILETVSEGHERRNEIDTKVGVSSGPYLERLQDEYNILKQISPIFSKSGSRNSRWEVTDMYLRFYFRFIHPNASYVEGGRYDLLRRSIDAGLEEYEGRSLEDYFRRRISEEDTYTDLGGWWSRDGTIEIDIVVVDDLDKKADIIEVKRNRDKYRQTALIVKGTSLDKELAGYSVSYRCLSMDDM